MTYTKAKAWAAAIGATCTAVVVFVGVLMPALGDGHVDGGELTTLVTAAVTLVGTVFAVWRVRNKPVK